jgi:response regulator NasT
MTRTLEPDLVLMDIGMPGLDGISAAREILTVRAVPIVLVTGHADPELVDQAAGIGILSYLVKPVNQRGLDAAIRVSRARFAEFQTLRKQVRSLTESLEIRKVVEQAKGILMKRLQVSEAEAFRRLQRQAASQRRSIRELADEVREADRFYQSLEGDQT